VIGPEAARHIGSAEVVVARTPKTRNRPPDVILVPFVGPLTERMDSAQYLIVAADNFFPTSAAKYDVVFLD
jgi:hypothetical protein